MNQDVDSITLNFSNDSLWALYVCLAIIMYGVALDLKPDDFKRLLKNPKPTLIGIFSQFLLLPAITFLLVVILKPAPSIAMGMMLVASCPGGNISNFMTYLAKGNTALSVSLTAFSSLAAVFMTPLNLKIWGSMYEPTNKILREVSLEPFEVFKAIALILIVPLILGMLTNQWKPTIAGKMAKILKPFSILIFLAFIAIAFMGNWDIFLNNIHHVIILVFFHNAIALLSGYWLARLSGLSFKDQKSLAIETGIQNSGLGLLLIFSFFNGLGGMALVAAWWGIWHIISGLSVAGYWSRYSKKTHFSIFKLVFYYVMRFYINVGLHFYFRVLRQNGKENIPKNGAIVFLANHQNAFLDPLLIMRFNNRYTHFLVRGDIFKADFARMVLGTMNMMPIFRMRDGIRTLNKNEQIFQHCYQLLNQNQALVIFPEGNHSIKRRLRPLTKGFTRVIFGALDHNPDQDIYIVPVGLNYSSHQKFRSEASVYYGKPILANPYYQKDNIKESVKCLREKVSKAISELTTHIEDDEAYTQIIEKLNNAQADYIDPIKTNLLVKNIDQVKSTKPTPALTLHSKPIRAIIKMICRIINGIPLMFWHTLQKGIKDPAFEGSLKFLFGIFVFPFYYFVLCLLIYFLLGIKISLIVLPFLLLSMPILRSRKVS